MRIGGRRFRRISMNVKDVICSGYSLSSHGENVPSIVEGPPNAKLPPPRGGTPAALSVARKSGDVTRIIASGLSDVFSLSVMMK